MCIFLIGCVKNKSELDHPYDFSDTLSVFQDSFPEKWINCDSILKLYISKNQNKFNLDSYQEIYLLDFKCAQKLLTLLNSNLDVPANEKNTCNKIQKLSLLSITKSEIIELYINLSTAGNDNCSLELLRLLSINKDQNKHLIDTLLPHLDGYVSEFFCELHPERCIGIQAKELK